MKFFTLFTLIIFALLIVPQTVFGSEITTIPEKQIFGPNDWIKVLVDVDGYSGGQIFWNATKPDGTFENGFFTNIQASKVTHTINRNAFDNQFGKWQINYQYKDATKSIDVNVEPLVLSVTTDKPSYFPGDIVTVQFSTNYFEPSAAKAQNLSIKIVDENGIDAKLIDDIEIKVYQPVIIQQFSIDELLKYNPYGKYRAVVKYYNIEVDVPFEVSDADSNTLIFLGTDKSLYNLGDNVEVNIVIPELSANSGTLTVAFPSGKLMTKTIPISASLTRITLDDVTASEIGTFTYEFQYDGNIFSETFDVLSESLDAPNNNNLTIELTLDKSQYRPGETINAQVTTSKLIQNPIVYWFEDSLGNQGGQFSFANPASGTFTIPHILQLNSAQGPWKIHVKYGTVETFAIFFIAGEPLSPSEISRTGYEGPQVLLTIDSRVTDFSKISDLSVAPDDELFVLDSGNSKIKVFDDLGKLKKIWGGYGISDGLMKSPSAIFAEDNFVHVVDTGNSRLVTFDHDGNFVRNWGNTGIDYQSVKKPSDLTLDISGNYFVSDDGQNKILSYSKNGTYSKTIGSILTAAAKFSSIKSITSDQNNNLYLLSSNDNRILHFKNTGSFVQSFGTEGQNDKQLQNPASIEIDSNGYLYVSDSGNHRVNVFDTGGNFITKWGTFGNGPGQFNQMGGIDVDSHGNVWVVDSGTNRIQKFASILGTTEITIPDWIRNNAKWWNENKISDDDFATGIEYMIREKIIMIPDLGDSEIVSETQIPYWVKNSANWWADGLVSDQEFANAIEFLVKSGIIHV